MYAIFDSDKKFISYADQKMETPFFCIEIPLDKSDVLKWRWEGNFENGQMVKIDESPYPNFYNEKSFQDKYPFDFFMSILLKQLFITSKQNNTCQNSFQKMVEDYVNSFENKESFLNLLKLTNNK